MNKTFLFILSLFLIPLAASGCDLRPYSVETYFMCRIPVNEAHTKESMIELWQRTLLPDVPAEEIAKLIFPDGNSIEQLRELNVSPVLQRQLSADGNELLEYVCMMREVNKERSKLANPWHYRYARSTRLNKMADECMKRLDTRYGDRYAILAARALITLNRNRKLNELAKSYRFKDKEMEALFRPEYAGALYKLGKYEEAAAIYAEAGDAVSLQLCLEKLGLYEDELSVMSRMAKYDSNYDCVASGLAAYIHTLEAKEYGFDEYVVAKRIVSKSHLLETARACSAKPNKCQPLWRYAEAIVYLLDNNFAKADSVLALANTPKIDYELGKSVRALRFITQSKLRPYDSNYVPWVAQEAKWLIQQSDEQKSKLSSNEPCHSYRAPYASDQYLMQNRMEHYSVLYFSDMLHKAADVIVVPRLLQHGDTIAVLQLLDIVDYANLTNAEVSLFDNHGNSSACFAVECGADIIIKVLGRNANPQTSLDQLWRETGSIRNYERWLDLAGTTLLAEGRYKEAVEYFKEVSNKYAESRNIQGEKKIRNPFAVEFRADTKCTETVTKMKTPQYYKLWFAKKMSELEDIVNDESQSREKRAEAKLKYGVGMANSVYPCWSLTRYGEGSGLVFYPCQGVLDNSIVESSSRDLAHYAIIAERDQTTRDIYGYANIVRPYFEEDYGSMKSLLPLCDKRLRALRMRGERHIKEALPQIHNPEAKAAYLKSMGHYKTIKHHYANTSVGKKMKSKCDRWNLY